MKFIVKSGNKTEIVSKKQLTKRFADATHAEIEKMEVRAQLMFTDARPMEIVYTGGELCMLAVRLCQELIDKRLRKAKTPEDKFYLKQRQFEQWLELMRICKHFKAV